MKPSQMAVIRELRDSGYAVVVWTPEELQGANATRRERQLEDRSIELGYEIIECLKEDNDA